MKRIPVMTQGNRKDIVRSQFNRHACRVKISYACQQNAG